MHSHFIARAFVVGVLGLRTERGMPFECSYCCLSVVEFVWSPEGSYAAYS